MFVSAWTETGSGRCMYLQLEAVGQYSTEGMLISVLISPKMDFKGVAQIHHRVS
jgi:hypothetical protein